MLALRTQLQGSAPLAFERTTAYTLIRRILTTFGCYSRMADDRAPVPAAFRMRPIHGVEYILARVDGEPAGVFLLVGFSLTREVHFCLLPATWGSTEAIARGFLAWTWANTPITRLVGAVPAHNRLALRLAKSVGFTEFDYERDALRKNGKLYDRNWLEIKRP